MTDLKKCDRCDECYETWHKFGRRLPKANVKERAGAVGLYRYTEADLCRSCAKDLEKFMDGRLAE